MLKAHEMMKQQRVITRITKFIIIIIFFLPKLQSNLVISLCHMAIRDQYSASTRESEIDICIPKRYCGDKMYSSHGIPSTFEKFQG